MLSVTKIFYFEMAHAIHGYAGYCKNIHGHSYMHYVTITTQINQAGYIPSPGMLIDFKELKKLVIESVINKLDHHLVLSSKFLEENSSLSFTNNLVIMDAEPTVENLLVLIKDILLNKFSPDINLTHLKMYETKDSYAEWTNTKQVKL